MLNTPVLADQFKQKDLFPFFSRAAMEKAFAYHAQGRVQKIEVSEDRTHVAARVRGSGNAVYSVDISLTCASGRLASVAGDCTCPMAFNCKHIAATLLEALRTSVVSAPSRDAAGAAAVGTPSAPVLGYDVVEWLEHVGQAVRGDQYPDGLTQRLLYCLQPETSGSRMARVSLSLLSAKVTKSGQLGGSISRPSVGDFAPERAPKYFRDIDIDILVQLSSRSSAGYYGGRPVHSAELLKQIVATGRAFWKDHNGPPLRWGEPRQGRIEWRQPSKAGMLPRLMVDSAMALNAEPPVYFDETGRTLGPVEVNLPPRLAYRLLNSPAIPREQVAEVSRRLGQSVPDLEKELLPGQPTAAINISEDPIPVLRLTKGRANSNPYYYEAVPDYIPVARLGFRYGPVAIEPQERANQVEIFLDGQVFEVARRRAKEKQAIARLADFDFRPARNIYSMLDVQHASDLSFEETHEWLDFIHRDVDALRTAGFEVRIDDDFPFRLAPSSGDFDAGFESSGIDWFELKLGVEIDGERRDLAPMVAALVAAPGFDPAALAELAAEGDHLYLPLADGRHLALAADRFLPLVLALHSLTLGRSGVDPSRGIRLSRAEVAPLLGLENGEFVFKTTENLRRLASLLGNKGVPAPALPAWFTAVLRPYQAQGVAWLDVLRESDLGGVLADDMGLGKTVQILALLASEKARGNLTEPAIVVMPTSLVANWLNEAQRFAPELRVLVLHGAGRKQSFDAIADHDLVLTTYPLIARDHEVLLARQWHMAILDEAQTIKNSNAATTRWLYGIRARHRFCLTGTPMENHLGELWSLMNFANPGYLGDRASFVRNWRSPIEKRADTSRAKALMWRIKPFLLRRTKAEVVSELPRKSEFVESVVLDGKQRELYDSIRLSMSEKVRKAIAERGLAKSHILLLEALLRLRQVCCDPALLRLADGIDRPSAKLDRLMEMTLELLSEGRKIILFSQFTSMLDLIRTRFDAHGIRYSLLTGKTKDRKSAIDGFQAGASNVFLISLKAGGVGLNLTAADCVIIFDPWWNPAVEEQAIDRAHRIGQDKAVFVYRLVASGTIEEKMDELKARKRALADSLFDQEGHIGSALTEEDVQRLFEE